MGALLALLTLGASAWLLLAERRDTLKGWLDVDTALPWGPPVNVFPDFTGPSVWPAPRCVARWPPRGCSAARVAERRAAGEFMAAQPPPPPRNLEGASTDTRTFGRVDRADARQPTRT